MGTVKDAWNHNTMDRDFQPRRALRNFELQQWADLKSHLTAPCNNNDRGPETPIWKINSNDNFSIASVKKAIHILWSQEMR